MTLGEWNAYSTAWASWMMGYMAATAALAAIVGLALVVLQIKALRQSVEVSAGWSEGAYYCMAEQQLFDNPNVARAVFALPEDETDDDIRVWLATDLLTHLCELEVHLKDALPSPLRDQALLSCHNILAACPDVVSHIIDDPSTSPALRALAIQYAATTDGGSD